MKPAWDQLIDEFKGSKSGLVADVDCTAGGKSLCEKQGVSGYPTIKWGDPSDLKDYSGGRDLATLQEFAKENLGPTCGPSNLDLCDAEEQKMIKKYLKWDLDELDMEIEEKDKRVIRVETEAQKAVTALEKQIRDLQSKIESETKKKESAIADVKKTSGYKFMKMVKANKFPSKEEAKPAVDNSDDDPELA